MFIVRIAGRDHIAHGGGRAIMQIRGVRQISTSVGVTNRSVGLSNEARVPTSYFCKSVNNPGG